VLCTVNRLCDCWSDDVCLCVAGGIPSAVAAVSPGPGGFPMLIQHPGSIPAEILAVEQQRRATASSQLQQQQQQQRVSAASLASRVCTVHLILSCFVLDLVHTKSSLVAL